MLFYKLFLLEYYLCCDSRSFERPKAAATASGVLLSLYTQTESQNPTHYLILCYAAKVALARHGERNS